MSRPALLKEYLLEPMAEGDWEAVRAIYLDGIATGQLSGLIHSGLWIDVGTTERLATARAALAALDEP